MGIYGSGFGTPSSLAQVNSPSTVLSVLETTWTNTDFVISDPNNYFDGNNGPGGSNVNVFAGHTAQSNYLFYDGHVKTQRPLQTLAQSEGGSNTLDEWTRDGSAIGNPAHADTILVHSANFYKP